MCVFVFVCVCVSKCTNTMSSLLHWSPGVGPANITKSRIIGLRCHSVLQGLFSASISDSEETAVAYCVCFLGV